jgi:hypothetical protein
VQDEIATEFALLIACYPHQDKGKRRTFFSKLCEDVTYLEPSAYALHLACRRLRQNLTFLPAIAEVLNYLKTSIKQAKCLEDLQGRLSQVEEALDDFERDLPRLRQRREEEDKRERKKCKERAKDWPPEDYPGFYNDHQLKLLGLTREELEGC